MASQNDYGLAKQRRQEMLDRLRKAIVYSSFAIDDPGNKIAGFPPGFIPPESPTGAGQPYGIDLERLEPRDMSDYHRYAAEPKTADVHAIPPGDYGPPISDYVSPPGMESEFTPSPGAFEDNEDFVNSVLARQGQRIEMPPEEVSPSGEFSSQQHLDELIAKQLQRARPQSKFSGTVPSGKRRLR